jgi:superfamily II DNA or RNA helicase
MSGKVSNKQKENEIYLYTVPEAGQLVEVRRRQWIVEKIQTATLIDGISNFPQHLISLSAIDEDSLGEGLSVIWELEPGARTLENAGLPTITGHDESDRMEAFLDAVRWGAAVNADRSFLQAPFRSGVTIEDYQLDPLVRAIDMARVNLLIADDVGLGKTIEAGLVAQELLVRHRARTVLVVCPSSLQIKWQTEMREKFGLEFHIVDSNYIRSLRKERGIHVNPWGSFPRLISSMDWMKSGDALRLLKDILPPTATFPRKFDLLIIDEAHNIAPAAASRYALESQRTRLIRTIAPHFEHRLFLTATPHNGHQESFTALLELLDDQRFARTVAPDERQLQKIMVRRLKTDLVDSVGKPLFAKRELRALELDYSEEEKKIHLLLQAYTKNRTESMKSSTNELGLEFIHKLLKKRLFSSPRAFAVSLARHRDYLINGKQKSIKDKFDNLILRKAILRCEEEYANDKALETALESAVNEASALPIPLTTEQSELLSQLSSWADLNKNKADSKAHAILEWIESHLKTEGEWNDYRVILFTEYRPTQSWLNEILTSYGFGGDRLMVLNGDTSQDERERMKAAFQTSPTLSSVRILLATDAASEGIDLQNHCNYLIHVEIPWNPNVMEQRNGRIDRHGQKYEKVFIWHPVGKGFNGAGSIKPGDLAGDHEFLMKAVLKVEAMREDLGSVGSVIAQQIEEAMLGKILYLDTRNAEIKSSRARKFIVTENKIKERIQKLHERILETKKDFNLTPDRVAKAVNVALELGDLPSLKKITLSGAENNFVYEVPILPGAWGRALAGLEHPYTKLRRPITFDHAFAKDRDDVVLAHLNHKLVQLSLRLLRAEVWALDDLKKLHRVTFRSSTDLELSDPAIIVFSRLVITGGNHHRLHEELTSCGVELKGNNLNRISQVSRVEVIYEKSIPLKPNEITLSYFKTVVSDKEKIIRSAVNARSRDRLQNLESTLTRLKNSEVEDLNSILTELERAIKNELTQTEPEQLKLDLWPEEQRRQLRKDIAALEARLARIPLERSREISAIESRYNELTDRTFPVAMAIVLPKSWIERFGK